MTGMIFGPIPKVDEVVAAIAGVERSLNRRHEFAEFRAVAVHDLYITCHLTTLVPLYVRL
jgi:hypothetical protein